jgi:hypothetical protein
MHQPVPLHPRSLATPSGVPGRQPEIPAHPPGAPGPSGPDIRPPPPEIPDIPNPAEAPVLDPPLAPPSPPLMMRRAALALTLRRAADALEEVVRALSAPWRVSPAAAPVRVTASYRRPGAIGRRPGN